MSDDLIPMRFIPPIIDALKRGIKGHDVVARNLGSSEGEDVIGVFPANWSPDLGSKEIGNIEPTEARYVIRIQNMRIDADEIIGRAKFNNTCRAIRAILYRDPVLRLALGGLSETIAGSTERVKKYDVTKQDYLSGRLGDGNMTYFCTTEMVVTTETTKD